MFRKFSASLTRITFLAFILVLLAGTLGAGVRPAAAAADDIALSIVSVGKGEVTIEVVNMPAGKDFRVLMNAIGTKGVDGITVGTAKTGKDGSFKAILPIPADLMNQSTIAIRVEAMDRSGFYAYNWFTNSYKGSGTSSGGSTTPPGNPSYATGNLAVVEVEEDHIVSIRARNLAARSTYVAWLGWKNRSGEIKEVRAGTAASDSSGRLDATIGIPVVLKDRNELRIRLQATTGSASSIHTWFLNADSDGDLGSGSPSGYDKGLPYVVVSAVAKGDSVTIEARNFPAKKEVDVLMGKMGTQGVDGIWSGSIKAGKDGAFTATFRIPEKLRERGEIAIRLEVADTTAYYAYNWFTNTTTP